MVAVQHVVSAPPPAAFRLSVITTGFTGFAEVFVTCTK